MNIFKYLKIAFLLITILVLIFIFKTNFTVKNFHGKYERTLLLDRRKPPTEDFYVRNIAKEIPYLPIEDLINPEYAKRNLNKSCAWYPTFLNVKIHNDYWQEYENANFSFRIYGAYYDNRPTVVQDQPVVRVLVMLNFIAKTYEGYPLTYCQLWYEEEREPFVTPMKEMHKIWLYEWGHRLDLSYAHLVSCPVKEEYKNKIPKTISLVASPCLKATNNVRVTYLPLAPNEKRKDFAVCVKGLDYPQVDISHRLVEFMETMRSLGAEKVTMYKLQIHPNTTKVLEYYENIGFLEYRPYSLSTAVSNLHNYRHFEMLKNRPSKTRNEVITYNDCLYRSMYRYKYIAAVDIDEVLMPLGNFTNWRELMDYAETIRVSKNNKIASYCFRCTYFPSYPEKPLYSLEIPEYFYMLQHVERVRQHMKPTWATKCLHNTDYVIATHNHISRERAHNVVAFYSFPPNVAQLNHYREPDKKETLNDSVVDLSLWRMKDHVIERSMKVFEKLKLFDNN